MPRWRNSTELTLRELQVLRLASTGLTSEEIAARLGLNWSTVKSHLQQVSRVLNTGSRYEAVVEAMRRGLVAPLPPADLSLVSEYEARVLGLVARGMKNADVGRALFFSEDAVKDHVKNGLKRLGLPTRMHLIRSWPGQVAVSRAS